MNDLKCIAKRLLGRNGLIAGNVADSLSGKWESRRNNETLKEALNQVLSDHARNNDIGSSEESEESFVTSLLNSRIKEVKPYFPHKPDGTFSDF